MMREMQMKIKPNLKVEGIEEIQLVKIKNSPNSIGITILYDNDSLCKKRYRTVHVSDIIGLVTQP